MNGSLRSRWWVVRGGWWVRSITVIVAARVRTHALTTHHSQLWIGNG